MKSIFIAYVDESGDEGVFFHSAASGGSRRFVPSIQSWIQATLARVWGEEAPCADKEAAVG